MTLQAQHFPTEILIRVAILNFNTVRCTDGDAAEYAYPRAYDT